MENKIKNLLGLIEELKRTMYTEDEAIKAFVDVMGSKYAQDTTKLASERFKKVLRHNRGMK